MKNFITGRDGERYHIINYGKDNDVNNWILDKCCFTISREIARCLDCKPSKLNYYINLCSCDKNDGKCQDKHEDIWYGNIGLLDFFKKIQKEYPDHWMCLCATPVSNIEDVDDDNFFWIADATVDGENFYTDTDVGGLIRYVWKNCQKL